MYALVDCNTFYASCESIFRPDLEGKPIVVLSNNDGCVISLNTEAKAFNIPSYVPFYQVRDEIEKNNVHIFSSNYELYGDISARVMNLLKPYSTEMEVYSIDEAFLRLPRVDYQEHSKAMKDMLWQNVRMPVCVGVAPTKTLAKLANHAAKKMKHFNGVCVLDEPHKWEWVLARITTDKLWGVGKRICERLHHLGIHNALQLAQANSKYLRKHFSVVLERTARELNGEPCLDLNLDPAPRKEIICTRSFSYKITELHELQQAISLYASRACEKLRSQNGLTQTIWVYLESFDKRIGHYSPHRVISLPHLTNDTRFISSAASKALINLFKPDIRYKKCGIGLLDVRTKKYEQGDFFNPQQTEHSRQLMTVLDKVNRRYGKHTMKLANTGIQPKWSMKRDYMSPRYSTRWRDIPIARC
ncbi:translesion error-prone DNA polymerase V subunit UmuC [Haliea sp. AH-315-K21]|uniref:UMUC domain-containing protein DNA-repair protein n=1 Tax=SAR86 cluster bacterium TaxID=2030880 RepID=A0A2A5CBB9_9GAMM|nr:translesion error-prone DNA polymerase V subunit UmuC [Haliea sp. AH-315-K21]PCJ41184.1 MAG: UMUC domain-containing protein DNA-repair protein [SAR86 cluster bacterium]